MHVEKTACYVLYQYEIQYVPFLPVPNQSYPFHSPAFQWPGSSLGNQ